MFSRFTRSSAGVSKGIVSVVLASGLVLGLTPHASALSSSSSSFLPITQGPSISVPAPKDGPALRGEGVSLSELRDSGDVVKAPVTIGGQEYLNSWSFIHGSDLEVQLNGAYTTLSGTFGIEDGSDAIDSAELVIRRGFNDSMRFKVTKDNPVRDFEIDVSGVEELKINAIVRRTLGEEGKMTVGLADAIVYK